MPVETRTWTSAVRGTKERALCSQMWHCSKEGAKKAASECVCAVACVSRERAPEQAPQPPLPSAWHRLALVRLTVNIQLEPNARQALEASQTGPVIRPHRRYVADASPIPTPFRPLPETEEPLQRGALPKAGLLRARDGPFGQARRALAFAAEPQTRLCVALGYNYKHAFFVQVGSGGIFRM